MIVLFFSDIHGNLDALEAFLAKPIAAQATKLFCCGDYFNHHYYDDNVAKKIARLLNKDATRMMGVRGNTDLEYQLDWLDFSVNQIVLQAEENAAKITLFHGDRILRVIPSEDKSSIIDIIVQGHTHIANLTVSGRVIHLNPGSIAYPRNHLPPSYAVWRDNSIAILSLLDDSILYKIDIP